VDDGGVTEADVDRGRARDALERTVERREAVCARLLGPRLHVRLVDLHDVRAGREQVADLLVDGRCVVHRRELAAAAVGVDLRLLRHGEGPGTVIFTGRVVCAFRNRRSSTSTGRRRRIFPTTRGTGFGGRCGPAPCQGCRVDALERSREAVRVALAADFAVGDDVDPGLLLRADRDDRGVVLCLGEERLGMRHSSRARTRGGKRPASFARSISHSGCGSCRRAWWEAASNDLGSEGAGRGGIGLRRQRVGPQTALRDAGADVASCSPSSGAGRTLPARRPSNCTAGRTASRAVCGASTGTTSPSAAPADHEPRRRRC